MSVIDGRRRSGVPGASSGSGPRNWRPCWHGWDRPPQGWTAAARNAKYTRNSSSWCLHPRSAACIKQQRPPLPNLLDSHQRRDAALSDQCVGHTAVGLTRAGVAGKHRVGPLRQFGRVTVAWSTISGSVTLSIKTVISTRSTGSSSARSIATSPHSRFTSLATWSQRASNRALGSPSLSRDCGSSPPTRTRRPPWTSTGRAGRSAASRRDARFRNAKRSLPEAWRDPDGGPAVTSCWSELESGGGGHHRRSPGVHGGDDLFGVDASQIDAGRAEVGVPPVMITRRPSRQAPEPADHLGERDLVVE